MSGVYFGGPPPENYAKYPHKELVAECKARPGEWAYFVAETNSKANSIATQMKNGRIKPYGGDMTTWEITWRLVEGECRVYVRWLGER